MLRVIGIVWRIVTSLVTIGLIGLGLVAFYATQIAEPIRSADYNADRAHTRIQALYERLDKFEKRFGAMDDSIHRLEYQVADRPKRDPGLSAR